MAILGWLALVVVSVFIGCSVGLQNIKDEDAGNGESRQADQALAAAGFKDRASEQVLVQAANGRLTRLGPGASGPRSATSSPACAHAAHVSDVQSPLARGERGPGLARRALGAGDLRASPATPTSPKERVERRRSLAAAAAQRPTRGLRIEQFGDASADKALTRRFEDDFQQGRDRSRCRSRC